MSDIEVDTIVRTHFPEPAKYGLPGLFKGDDISEFVEYFEEAYVDYRITKDKDKVSRFARWCDLAQRRIIQRFDDEERATWVTFSSALKEHWYDRDSEQFIDDGELDHLIDQTLPAHTDTIFLHLERVEGLIARIPKVDVVEACKTAVRKLWTYLPDEVQAGLRAYVRDDIELKAMDFKRFRTFVQGSLRKGFNAGPVFLKSSQKSLTPRETSVSGRAKSVGINEVSVHSTSEEKLS